MAWMAVQASENLPESQVPTLATAVCTVVPTAAQSMAWMAVQASENLPESQVPTLETAVCMVVPTLAQSIF